MGYCILSVLALPVTIFSVKRFEGELFPVKTEILNFTKKKKFESIKINARYSTVSGGHFDLFLTICKHMWRFDLMKKRKKEVRGSVNCLGGRLSLIYMIGNEKCKRGKSPDFNSTKISISRDC